MSGDDTVKVLSISACPTLYSSLPRPAHPVPPWLAAFCLLPLIASASKLSELSVPATRAAFQWQSWQQCAVGAIVVQVCEWPICNWVKSKQGGFNSKTRFHLRATSLENNQSATTTVQAAEPCLSIWRQRRICGATGCRSGGPEASHLA